MPVVLFRSGSTLLFITVQKLSMMSPLARALPPRRTVSSAGVLAAVVLTLAELGMIKLTSPRVSLFIGTYVSSTVHSSYLGTLVATVVIRSICSNGYGF